MFAKSSVLALFLGSISAHQYRDLLQAEEIVIGMLKGALDAEGFTDIERCIKDGVTIVKDSEIAIQDFETKTAEGVAEGLKMLAEVLTTTSNAMKDCSSIKADWQKLT